MRLGGRTLLAILAALGTWLYHQNKPIPPLFSECQFISMEPEYVQYWNRVMDRGPANGVADNPTFFLWDPDHRLPACLIRAVSRQWLEDRPMPNWEALWRSKKPVDWFAVDQASLTTLVDLGLGHISLDHRRWNASTQHIVHYHLQQHLDNDIVGSRYTKHPPLQFFIDLLCVDATLRTCQEPGPHELCGSLLDPDSERGPEWVPHFQELRQLVLKFLCRPPIEVFANHSAWSMHRYWCPLPA